MKTYAELADMLHVSTATVSNALSAGGRMRPELRAKILEAAQREGLAPSRRRSKRATKRLCVITENVSTWFCSHIISGITKSAQDAIVTVYDLGIRMASPVDAQNDAIAERLRTLVPVATQGASGVIYVAQYPRDVTGLMPTLPCPIVYTYCSTADNSCAVLCDDEQGAYLAATHLIEQGRRRLSMISGPINNLPTSNRLIGFQRAIVANGLTLNPARVRVGEWGMQSGYTAMRELLSLSCVPDAVFAQNDTMAVGALRAIAEAGLRVPQDICIIGFDNIAAPFSSPALSSVVPPLEELGQKAVDMLAATFAGKPPRTRKLLLPCSLALRASTGFQEVN